MFRQVERYEDDWLKGTANLASPLLKCFKDPVEGKPLVRDNDELNRRTRYMGFFAILSDAELEPKEALEIYRTRDCVEKCFTAVKTDVGFTTTRGHTDATVNARMLLAFVAATIVSWIVGKMSRPSVVGKTKMEPLLDTYSLMEMLEELEQVRFYSAASGKAWVGEVIKRHQQIFERLGIADCLSNPATYN